VTEQALAILVSGVTLCRARVFRERAQVLAVAVSGLAGLVIAFSAMAKNALPDLRAMWLAPLLVVVALLALALASIRPRRGTTQAVVPPRWSRTVDMVETGIFLAVLPVLMAVLGVYGKVQNLKG
jgi:peptidoglycan/LPS O-acetylase OafA/YrhL